MAKDFDYQVLTAEQVALFDNYSGASYKLKMSEIMDDILNVTENGIIDYLSATYDVLVGRDCTVTRNLTCLTLQVGGGYGTTGVTMDADGNIFADGVGDFMASGIKTVEDVPANAGATGEKGMVTYGNDGFLDYVYVCIDTNTWMRAPIATW